MSCLPSLRRLSNNVRFFWGMAQVHLQTWPLVVVVDPTSTNVAVALVVAVVAMVQAVVKAQSRLSVPPASCVGRRGTW